MQTENDQVNFNNETEEVIDCKEVWSIAIEEIKNEVSAPNFKVLFTDTYISGCVNGVVSLSVSSVFVRDFIRDKFQSLVLRILRNIHPNIRGITYIITQRSRQKPEKREMAKKANNTQIPLNEFYVDKNDNLNPKYLFSSFVVGPFNQLAHAAAKLVTQRPGTTYNPLFIYGHTGHGKTHLIQAVGNALKKADKKVFYVTSERFAVDFINSLQNGSANSFKDKYRQYDVLIMDDVQFLSTKEKTQEELFHLFNAMFDNNKQIVFSSDIHPSLMSGMEDRLRSRFSQGMIIDIPKPDLESRIAILASKAAQSGSVIENKILSLLAESIEGNIRELEGALNSLNLQAQINKHPLTFDEVYSYVQDNIKTKRKVTPKDVIIKVANMYNLEVNELFEKTRRKEIVHPRQLTMYILREDFKISYPLIGLAFGGRDHTTVLHSCEKVKKDLAINGETWRELERIRSLFK